MQRLKNLAVRRYMRLPAVARPTASVSAWRGAALLATVLLALPAAFAQLPPESDDSAARARIDAQRQRIEARFAAEQKACFQHFAVNDCRAESQRRRRSELAVLRRDEIQLNDAERQRKAAERQHDIDAKTSQRADRAKRSESAPQQGGARQSNRRLDHGSTTAARPPEPSAARPNPPIVPRARPRADPAERLAREANKRSQRASEDEANAARYEREQREAAEHKADVLRKNAERVKPVAPLPVPPPAAAAPDRR